MNFYTIDTGHLMLDGGAMFGVVPKTIWQKLNPSDENNLTSWAMRCLLVEVDNRLILVDNGMGNKQSEKFFSYYEPHGQGELHRSIREAGFDATEITDVILTHLHFDHCGGSVNRNASGGLELAFPNANYWVHSQHRALANTPNPREAASFLKENIQPIEASGQLCFVDQQESIQLPSGIELVTCNGHTEAQIIPVFKPQSGPTIAFAADLIPSAHHIKPHYVPAYDTTPLVSMQEKEAFVKRAFEEQWWLFYEHDPMHECSQIIQGPKGLKAGETLRLSDIV